MPDGTEDGIEIEVEGDAADQSGAASSSASAEPKPTKQDAAADVLRGQVERLQADLAAERRQTETARIAESDARTRANEASRIAAETRRAAQADAVASREARATAIDREADGLEERYAVALRDADHMQAAKIQRQMARLEAERHGLERDIPPPPPNKADGRVVREEAPPPAPRTNEELVEAFASQIGRENPKSAAWIRAHPDYVTDRNKNTKLQAYHNLAVADGLAIDSPEYFARIEEGLGLRSNGASKDASLQSTSNARSATTPPRPSAPAGGTGDNGMSKTGSMKVRLTKSEAETATDGTITWSYNDPNKRFKKGDPIGTVEYARRKAAMTADGRIGNGDVQQ